MRTQVVVVDSGGVLGDKVLVTPLAAQINDVGDAFVDPRLKLCRGDFWSGGVEVSGNSEPLVDVAHAPMPDRRIRDAGCRHHESETHDAARNVHRVDERRNRPKKHQIEPLIVFFVFVRRLVSCEPKFSTLPIKMTRTNN